MMIRQPDKKRRSAAGSNLALIAVSLATLIALMGVGIYTGVQAYLRNELQKAATTAAMAGAAVYMKGGSGAQPGVATATAKDVFEKVYSNTPALRTFDAKLKSLSTNAGNDTVTVGIDGSIPTPFMALVGINKIDVSADGSAKALRYIPTSSAGSVVLAAPAVRDAFIQLEFPLVDNGPGVDMVTHSGWAGDGLRGYIVFACTSGTNICYNIMDQATGGIRNTSNGPVCYGSCSFDIGKSKVYKATSIRFVDDGIWNVFINGESQIDTRQSATVIHTVELYGYAGSCASATKCGIPRGFAQF